MTRYLFAIALVLTTACSGIHVPDVDAASPPGDVGPLCPSLDVYNGSADRMSCPRTMMCPACPVLINSGHDCATLARALDVCPDGGM